ncbi:GntR family transcriptional regulator [Paracoccus sp. S1E-3]|nr:GntR family transcriptional regulator [Paracoccus sp. S1E-3]
MAREIAAGHLLDGERLAPERELAARFGASVGTLRKSLAELTGQGLLEWRHAGREMLPFLRPHAADLAGRTGAGDGKRRPGGQSSGRAL